MNVPDPAALPPVPDERLDAWLDEALPPAEAAAVAERVATDPVWADAAAVARSLREALAGAALPTAPVDFRARVLAALPDAAPETRRLPAAPNAAKDRPAAPRGRVVRLTAGLMAALTMLLVVTYAIRPAPEPQYSAEEVAQARAELEWTLAYLNTLNAKTAANVADALPPVEPTPAGPAPAERP